jgi:hypothetical protein
VIWWSSDHNKNKKQERNKDQLSTGADVCMYVCMYVCINACMCADARLQQARPRLVLHTKDAYLF